MKKGYINKKLKALVSMVTLATVALSTSVSAVTLNDGNAKSTTSTKRHIGYYADWAVYDGEGNCMPDNVPAEYLTHLNVAFTGCNKDGTLLMLDGPANFHHPLNHAKEGMTWEDFNGGIVNDLQNIRAKNPNLKLGFSIGGWSMSGEFTWVARSSTARKTFAQEVAKLLDYTNYDFIDIDWEYPGDVRPADKIDNKNDQGNPDAIPEDKENYILLLEEIRSELDKLEAKTGKNYEMSAAINMSHAKTELGIDVPKLFSILDFVNVMTYDANGAWSDVSGHQTALYDNPADPWAGKGFTVDSSIQNFLKLGAPAEKLVVGVAYYTRGWEKVANDGPYQDTLPGLFGSATKVNRDADLALGYGAKNDKPIETGNGGRHAGNWAWRNRDLLHAQYPGLVEYWDDVAKAPYLYSKESGAFFTYDNKRSIDEKTKYVNANNLGGIITWMVSNDKQTATGRNDDLTKAIYDGLYGNSKLPTYPIVPQPVDGKIDLSIGQNNWEQSSLLNVRFTNTGKINSGNLSTMTQLANQADALAKFIKVYIKANGITLTAGQECPPVTYENGYYVINTDSHYSHKLIKAGGSANFQLRVNGKLADLSAIEEIYVTERTHIGAPELNKTVLYQGTPVQYDREDVNKDKKIDVTDLSLVASKYNVKSTQAGFIADYDVNEDKIIDLYDLVRVAKKLDANTGGNTDPEEPEQPEQPNPGDTWERDKVYTGGQTVVYKGVTYKCKWWVQGQEPDKSDAWEKVN